MEGRCAGVETSPSPFYSAAFPPREVGGQPLSGSLSSLCYGAKVDVGSHVVSSVDVNMTLLRVCLAVSLILFLCPPRLFNP